jgi:hypothetical protein
VRLVWANALAYNRHPDNFVRQRALDLQNKFEDTFARIDKTLPTKKGRAAPRTPVTAVPVRQPPRHSLGIWLRVRWT